jgi:hypothetical protein
LFEAPPGKEGDSGASIHKHLDFALVHAQLANAGLEKKDESAQKQHDASQKLGNTVCSCKA